MKITLQDYLKNPSGFSREQLAEETDILEDEDFRIEGISKKILSENIVTFFNSKGLNISNADIKGSFRIKSRSKLIAIVVFTPFAPQEAALIKVQLLP
jgi:hypothetical protein